MAPTMVESLDYALNTPEYKYNEHSAINGAVLSVLVPSEYRKTPEAAQAAVQKILDAAEDVRPSAITLNKNQDLVLVSFSGSKAAVGEQHRNTGFAVDKKKEQLTDAHTL